MNFNESIKNGVHLVDFYADWCGPCKMMHPVLEQLKDKIDIIKINVDEEPDIAQQYGVMSIPTLVIFEQGEEKKRLIGYHTKDDIEKWF